MQPNQAPPPIQLPPNGDKNAYDFILDTKHQPKRGPTKFLTGGSMVQRIVVLVIGAAVLLTAVIVFVSFLSSSGKGNVNTLINLAQQQTELVRVATIGTEKAVSSATKNYASTVLVSIKTSQSETLALIQKNGKKLGAKDLALLKSTQADQQLEAATTNNNFDATFTKIVNDKLVEYQTSLQSAYKSATASEKELLQNNFNSAVTLTGSG